MNQHWRLFSVIPVGGLTMLGFAPDRSLLLVASTTGRGLFDVSTGDRLARDADDSMAWLDLANVRCQGIGSLSNVWIPMAGLWGGGLALGPFDSCPWNLEFSYESGEILLQQSGTRLSRAEWALPDIHLDSSFRAAGFAPTGQALVVATSSDITIYHPV